MSAASGFARLLSNQLHRGVGEVRFVLSIRLPVIELNVNAGWRGRALLQRKPNLIQIGGLINRAKAVEAITFLIKKIDPCPRSIRVPATGRQLWRGRKHRSGT